MNAKPASAAPRCPSVAFTSSGPPFRKVCSEIMISRTAPANPAPWASVNSACSGVASVAGGSSAAGAAPARILRRIAHGTTDNENSGAAAIPSATTDWPFAIPTAATTANATRDSASRSTSSPYSPNRWCPARNPRAK